MSNKIKENSNSNLFDFINDNSSSSKKNATGFLKIVLIIFGLINTIITFIRKVIYYFVDSKKFISSLYNLVIATVAVMSIVTLFVANASTVTDKYLIWILANGKIFILILIIDYLLRWIVADFSLKKGWKSFFIYPITFWAILDLLGILPYFISGKMFEMLMVLRVFRVIRIFPKLQEGFLLIASSVSRRWKVFVVILVTLLLFILVGGILIYNVEVEVNDNINSYLDAVWFVFISITTIGYGDIYPATEIGRSFTIVFSLVGIGLISIVTAIFAAGFNELETEEGNAEQVKHILSFTWEDDDFFSEHKSNLSKNKKKTKVLNDLPLSSGKDIKIDEFIYVFEKQDNDVLKTKKVQLIFKENKK